MNNWTHAREKCCPNGYDGTYSRCPQCGAETFEAGVVYERVPLYQASGSSEHGYRASHLVECVFGVGPTKAVALGELKGAVAAHKKVAKLLTAASKQPVTIVEAERIGRELPAKPKPAREASFSTTAKERGLVDHRRHIQAHRELAQEVLNASACQLSAEEHAAKYKRDITAALEHAGLEPTMARVALVATAIIHNIDMTAAEAVEAVFS